MDYRQYLAGLSLDELRILASDSPLGLGIVSSRGRVKTPLHLRILNMQLKKALATPDARVILTVPPRHGKSETTSKLFPAYAIGMFPWMRTGVISYSADFAAGWGRKARDILQEYGETLFGVRIRDDARARNSWLVEAFDGDRWITTEGGMITTGVMGPLSGRGLDLAIIDDPIKNAEEAFSAVQREKVWDWFHSTLMSRLEPGGRVCLVMTRWHEDDLAGRLISAMEAGGEKWVVINFPALAEEGDLLGRAVGEALWPERYNSDKLEKIRRDRGEYWFSALYQQRPIPLGKSVLDVTSIRSYEQDQWNYYLIKPEGKIAVPKDAVTRFTTIDLATSTKQTADYTVISTWANTITNDTLLLNVVRERFQGTEHLGLLTQNWFTWNPGVILVEAVQYQMSLVQQAINAGLPALPYTPDKDKLQRALPLAARIKAGTYYFPVYADWKNDVIKEMSRFPAGEHDDFVDTASLSALYTAGGGFVGTLE
jgi:predicted phage terminase large subunit-like protein